MILKLCISKLEVYNLSNFSIMMKKVLSVMLLISISLNLSGCAMLQSPSSLMYSPDTYIEGESSQEIKTLLNKYNYVITSPVTGEEKRSIIKTNLNGDTSEEILIIYKKANEDAIYGFLILAKVNESLKIICNETFQCKNIYSLSYADMDNDENKEILITTSSVDNDTKTLNIYKFIGKTTVKLFSKSCSDFKMFSKDSSTTKPYIILIEDDVKSHNKTLCMYQWKNNSMERVDSTDFDVKVKDAIIKVGKYDHENLGVFCTYNYNSEFIYSDVYTINKGQLSKITPSIYNNASDGNRFVYPIKHYLNLLGKNDTSINLNDFIIDVDNDGIYEFRMPQMIGNKKEDLHKNNIDYWYKLSDLTEAKKDKIESSGNMSKISYYDILDNYTLFLPGKYFSDSTLSILSNVKEQSNTNDFYISHGETESKWIFSITVYDKLPDGYTYPSNSNYSVFMSDYGNKIFAITYVNDFFKAKGLSDTDMKNDFFVFDVGFPWSKTSF